MFSASSFYFCPSLVFTARVLVHCSWQRKSQKVCSAQAPWFTNGKTSKGAVTFLAHGQIEKKHTRRLESWAIHTSSHWNSETAAADESRSLMLQKLSENLAKCQLDKDVAEKELEEMTAKFNMYKQSMERKLKARPQKCPNWQLSGGTILAFWFFVAHPRIHEPDHLVASCVCWVGAGQGPQPVGITRVLKTLTPN